jgi:DNA (cytosine-5)-methyltransferase 1
LKFVDLFAGLGGFHVALSALDDANECVLACEIDPELQNLYFRNFGIMPEGDIQDIELFDVPDHDLLCAGFPCQPFSKAGRRNGFSDNKAGGMFWEIVRILREKRPKYILLENVPNLVRHDSTTTWSFIKEALESLGYEIDKHEYSPDQFGVPQHRKRIFIVGKIGGLEDFSWPKPEEWETDIAQVLDSDEFGRQLPEQVQRAISVWQDFLDLYPPSKPLPSFPIWGMEFGANYPYQETTPARLGAERLREFHGALGNRLDQLDDPLMGLPSYARTDVEQFPRWKIRFIEQNRTLYDQNKDWLVGWMSKLYDLPASLQKLEWNAKGESRNLYNLIIQMRPSGLRAKRRNSAPALVAMTSTQVPIIPWLNRFLTPRECARLQSFNDPEFELPHTATRAYAALGNAVNTTVVREIASALVGATDLSKQREPVMEPL